MQSPVWETPRSASIVQGLFATLPFPLFVVDARAPGWPLLSANEAFVALIERPSDELGAPLDELVKMQVTSPYGTEELYTVLDTAATAGEMLRGRRVEMEGSDTLRTRWWLTLTPLTDDSGVWGVAGALLDDLGEGPGGPRRRRQDVLRTMATELLDERPVEHILRDMAAEAAVTAGARRAAVLLSDGREEFTVAARYGDEDLPPAFTVSGSVDGLLGVAMGRVRVAWTAARPHDGAAAAQALPFAGAPGWTRMLLVGLRVRGGGFGLLAVGDPEDGEWDDGALERLELAAVIVAAALSAAELRTQFSRLEDLLRGAVVTSAALTGHTDPGEVRLRLVQGIVSDMHLSGAALWLTDGDGAGGAVLAASAGLPPAVRAAVSSLPASDAVTDTAAGNVHWRIPSAATAARSWPGRHLFVVAVPEPARGALGVYAEKPLPGPASDIFGALAQALASAVHQTTLHRQARSVVASLQRQLEPGAFTPPPGLEAGHVYRSASAGVPIGGDFLDIFPTATGHIGLACGDVSGKGLDAAALSAMAVYSLRAFALQGAMPRTVAAMMDAAVEAQTDEDRFLTMAYARIQAREGSVELCAAGHPPPILVGPAGVTVLDITPDVPIGMLGSSHYHQKAFHLPEGHSLVLYTDGVTEARAPGDGLGLFGLDRLVATLEQLRDRDAQGIADGVWQRVQDWAAGATTDDCAVVVLRRTGA